MQVIYCIVTNFNNYSVNYEGLDYRFYSLRSILGSFNTI